MTIKDLKDILEKHFDDNEKIEYEGISYQEANNYNSNKNNFRIATNKRAVIVYVDENKEVKE